MHLARFAVQAQAAVVVDAVGDVGGLLNLRDEAAAADGVDAACGQEEDVSGVYLIAGQHIGDGAVGHLGGILLGRYLLREAGEQVGAGLGIHHVPHLRLALGAVVPFGGQLVIRVYLDAQVGEGVDELNQQRELVSGVFIDVFSHQIGLVLFYQLGDGLSLQGAVGHYALVTGHAGELPAFADVFLLCFNAFVRGNLLSAPYDGFQDRFKFQRTHTHYFPILNSKVPPATMSSYWM